MERLDVCLHKRETGLSRVRTVLWALVIIIVFIAGTFILNKNRPVRPETIILISLDTTRADHLSCYGYPTKTTPHIDAFAKDAILFENCFANIPLTMPSHTSMFTGVIPPTHGVHDNYHLFTGSLPTLPQILQENGYRTYGIVSTVVLDRKFGLGRGFDVYYDRFDGKTTGNSHDSERTGNKTVAHALQWLDENQDKKKFIFVHFYDPHDAYRPPAPFDKQFMNPYDGEIAFVDQCIGLLLDKLKALHLYDDSLILITADHGELLGEHGELTHGYTIYQNALHVPLLVKPAGLSASHRIPDSASLIDITPTILAQCGLDVPTVMQGLDLSDYFTRPDHRIANRFVYNESLYPTKYNANSLLGLINDQWHYIQTTRPELYDRIADPKESRNLIQTESRRADLLKKQLRQILDAAATGLKSEVASDDKMARTLESLGYIGGAVSVDFEFNLTKMDPKDLIRVHADVSRAVGLSRDGQYDQSIGLCRRIIQDRPEIGPAYSALAESYEKLEAHDKAIEVLQEQLALLENDINRDQGPTAASLNIILKSIENVHFRLGNLFRKQGQSDEAMYHFRQCLKINPLQANAHNNLANALASRGKLDEAISHYRKALQAIPDYVDAHYNLAVIFITLGKLTEAAEHFQQALKADPDHIDARYNLGTVCASLGKREDAVIHLREALKRDPENAETHYALGKILHKMDKADEAIASYQNALRLNPDYVEAHYRCAGLLYSQQNIAKAVFHWKESIRLKPNWSKPQNDLAWVLATAADANLRNPSEAVRLANRACELTQHARPELLDTLAAAYAAAGEFAKATEIGEKALGLAGDNEEMARSIRKHLERYRANEPYIVE
jgi:tetratricopeptide (TPR) repeat protein